MNAHGPEIIISVAPSSPQHAEKDDHERWETEKSPCFPRPLCVALPPKRPARQTTEGAALGKPCPLSKPPREGGDNNENFVVSSPPKHPRRRLSRNQLLQKLTFANPPQRPVRQDSEALLLASSTNHSTFSDETTLPPLPGMTTASRCASFQRWPSNSSTLVTDYDFADTIIDEQDELDESCSLRLNGDESFRLDGNGSVRLDGSSSTRFHESSSADLTLECCPARPTRQRSAYTDDIIEEDLPVVSVSTSSTNTQQPDWVKLWESQGGGDFGGNASLANLWNLEGAGK